MLINIDTLIKSKQIDGISREDSLKFNNIRVYFDHLRKPLEELDGYIAGGSCLTIYSCPHNKMWTNLQPNFNINDIDIYFKTKTSFKDVFLVFKKHFPDILTDGCCVEHPILLLPKAIRNYPKLHIIVSKYGPMEELIDGFDFSVCQLGYDFQNIYVGTHTMDDIRTRTLRLLSLHTPEKIYYRILKYKAKGYIPTGYTEFMMELFKECADYNIADY